MEKSHCTFYIYGALGKKASCQILKIWIIGWITGQNVHRLLSWHHSYEVTLSYINIRQVDSLNKPGQLDNSPRRWPGPPFQDLTSALASPSQIIIKKEQYLSIHFRRTQQHIVIKQNNIASVFLLPNVSSINTGNIKPENISNQTYTQAKYMAWVVYVFDLNLYPDFDLSKRVMKEDKGKTKSWCFALIS